MKRSIRGPLLFILGVTISSFLLSVYYTKPQEASTNINVVWFPSAFKQIEEDSNATDKTEKEVNVHCECTSETTHKKYNFCYADPQNSTSVGKKFDCEHLKFLESFQLVDTVGPFVNLSDPVTNENEMMFVSAVSDSHFNQSIFSLNSIRKYRPNANFIVYGLNLSSVNADHYKNLPSVQYRPFNTSGYPEYVNQWMTYRFKPLIIAEVMKDYRNIWWIDAQFTMDKANMTQSLVNEVADRRKDELKMTLVLFLSNLHPYLKSLVSALTDSPF